jgi:hypothetical protein
MFYQTKQVSVLSNVWCFNPIMLMTAYSARPSNILGIVTYGWNVPCMAKSLPTIIGFLIFYQTKQLLPSIGSTHFSPAVIKISDLFIGLAEYSANK